MPLDRRSGCGQFPAALGISRNRSNPLKAMNIPRMLVVIGSLFQAALAGESALTTTYQPLNGLRAGTIAIVEVTCHHWHASSASSAVDLIAVRNVPPTDVPKMATDDLNLASPNG
jgi:hypothetical protein